MSNRTFATVIAIMPIELNLDMRAECTSFARASMHREADREVREAR
jgi:hypothetical protein